MIKKISTAAGANFVYINWSQPIFLPESYLMKFNCWRMPTETEYVCLNLEILPFHTMLTVEELFPGSRCVFTLYSIYNPASIDDGITLGVSTMTSCVYI